MVPLILLTIRKPPNFSPPNSLYSRAGFNAGMSPNECAHAAGASFLKPDKLQPTHKGAARRHGPKPTVGSFRAIDDATNPVFNKSSQLRTTRPRLTWARCWARVIATHLSHQPKGSVKNNLLTLVLEGQYLLVSYRHYANKLFFIKP